MFILGENMYLKVLVDIGSLFFQLTYLYYVGFCNLLWVADYYIGSNAGRSSLEMMWMSLFCRI
jgi:hypothetical protein